MMPAQRIVQDDPRLHELRRWLSLGHLFPTRDKRPACRWQRGADGSLPERCVAHEGGLPGLLRWLDRGGDHGVALALGDGLLVLDIDAEAGGAPPDAVRDDLRREGLVADTLTIRTPRGGLHAYFTAEPERLRAISQTVRCLRQVDLRLGGRGYVLVPPSPGYSVAHDREPAPAPPALIERLLAPRPGGTMPGEFAAAAVAGNEELAVPEAAPSGLLDKLPPSLRCRAVEEMLAVLPRPDVGQGRYEIWRDTAFALLDAARQGLLDEERAFACWRDWSLTGEGADPEEELRRRWEAFARGDAQREGGRIGFGTLVRRARARGWKTPKFDVIDLAAADVADGLPPRWPGRGRAANPLYAATYELLRRGFRPRYDAFTGRHALDGRGVDLDELVREARQSIAATGWTPADHHVRAACEGIARRNGFDGARDRLDWLRWDGKRRLDGWLSRVVGVGGPYVNAVGRLLVCGIVARQYAPGAKLDVTPVLVGPQGVGKSTLARLLALDDGWFAEMRLGLDDRQVYEATRGKLVVELAELAGHSRAELEQVKTMLTRQHLRVRPAYARDAQEMPMRHAFIITTNDAVWARDWTGGRRFFPVECDRPLGVAWLRENVEQIFAEAVVAVRRALDERALDRLLCPPEAVLEEAARRYERALPGDPLVEQLEAWFADGPRDLIVPSDSLRFALGAALDRRLGRGDEMRIGGTMCRLGFDRDRRRVDGRRRYCYMRGEMDAAEVWKPGGGLQ